MNIKELAKKLNLSITTVSRALGGYSDVSEKTRKKVKRFAKKYNYSPNPYASSLASGKSNIIGFVLSNVWIHSRVSGSFVKKVSTLHLVKLFGIKKIVCFWFMIIFL